ncbi:unnamed protein product [Echinostoma caproni]|uniref:TYR_PHOSPHATASE_2 domain-containing protein n=1 Tax=Echinostoma caproni TaxID=27848 RepID=A0A183A0M8_9TREM|nr:unnamed protein product [Echinostoma caproni]
MHQVRILVRVCESTYSEAALEAAGIQVVDLEFDDGAPPPDAVIEKWFQLITELWQTHPGSCVAVHCRAGLGRSASFFTCFLLKRLNFRFTVQISFAFRHTLRSLCFINGLSILIVLLVI